MQLFSLDATMYKKFYLFICFAYETIKKTALKYFSLILEIFSTVILSKSAQIPSHKNGSPRKLYTMTLFTVICYCLNGPNRRPARLDNMKERYLEENLFTPENLYKIAGAIHKEIHETIDGINKKFYTSG